MPPIYLGDAVVSVFKGEEQLSKLAIGNSIIELYTPTPTPTPSSSFDYLYETIALLHIPHVKNDIYGLHYDLIGTTDETTSSAYTFEKDNMYSWFN